jgi:adenylate cyclase
MTTIVYQHEKAVEEANLSLPLLEISRKHGIPHAAACGGHARCSTCRVLILAGHENVLPRNEAEATLASAKGFEANVRLACQTRVLGPITLRRLVWDDDDMELAEVCAPTTTGKEMPLAVLFSDVRDFTPFAESHLAYDVVHLLNRYFHKWGNAILRQGGYIDKYIGDGLMALFGLENEGPALACEKAVLAALEMLDELPGLNRYAERQFGTALHIGVGIHVGDVLVADVGHPKRRQFTAIGDVVNVASRIESVTKRLDCPLLVSEAVHGYLGPRLQIGRHWRTALKGKSEEAEVREVLGLASAWPRDRPETDRARQARSELDRAITRTDAPLFLRLAFHDAISYDPRRCTGGANGSIRFPEELAREENSGLARGVEVLGRVKERLPGVSWADLIALAGAVAVQKCGGPAIAVEWGRADADRPDLLSQIPTDAQSLASLKQAFADRGLSVRDFVVLLGGHTLGRARGVPFTADLFSFTNSYYRGLLHGAEREGLAVLAPEQELLSDPECRALVAEYAADQEHFFRDFAAAYLHLTWLGVR